MSSIDKVHDLKHAIYNVRNCIDLLNKDRDKETSSEKKELIEMAYKEINKAISLINNLYNIPKI